MAKPKGYGMDEKDMDHDVPDPVTHHTITCRHCSKTVETSVKYYMVCDDCRSSNSYRRKVKGYVDIMDSPVLVRRSE